MILHFVAHALPGGYPLSNARACWRLWTALRRALAEVYAACLMPNHLHLIVPARDAGSLRRRVIPVLVGFAQAEGGGPVWQRFAQPTLVRDSSKLAREIRYVLLNPTRARLVRDPASHVWSTYRDVIGATLDPWVDAAALAGSLGHDVDGFTDWFHRYVSCDPSVAIAGTAPPLAAPPRTGTATPLERIAPAARAAAATALTTERARQSIFRRAYILTARHQGWRRAAPLAAALGVSVETVRRHARSPGDRLLEVTRLYLGDDRLLSRARFLRAA
ncbi:MAG: hypothetical protein OZ928_21370 [Polyangiaceae bacterium]|nr:hypothetical protein [Polyangiaceae bacterium]